MTDNGSAMMAEEVREALHRLSILHETTLPYSPYQNAKQEIFWASIEGRLIAMLEVVEELTLDLLNEATQAWVENGYRSAMPAGTSLPAISSMPTAERFYAPSTPSIKRPMPQAFGAVSIP